MSVLDPSNLLADDQLPGEPSWEILALFPRQGQWTESEYLDLTDGTNRLVEYCAGRIEVLEMPGRTHQKILQAIYRALYAFVERQKLGEVYIAAMPVRTVPLSIREPDVFVILNARNDPDADRVQPGADLVIEVVSPDLRSWKRDWVEKKWEYAQAGFPEYWVIDPGDKSITVHQLVDETREYRVLGKFASGQRAASAILAGFAVEVDDILSGNYAL